MGIALILAAALAWWLHQRGELLPHLARWAGTGVAGLLALKLLEGGRVLPALLVAAAGYGWWRYKAPKAISPMAIRGAEALLGVARDAGPETIQLAWRSRMATAHPDAGGSTDAAQALTAARDLLLAHRSAATQQK
jgi:hypothetical protein